MAGAVEAVAAVAAVGVGPGAVEAVAVQQELPVAAMVVAAMAATGSRLVKARDAGAASQ